MTLSACAAADAACDCTPHARSHGMVRPAVGVVGHLVHAWEAIRAFFCHAVAAAAKELRDAAKKGDLAAIEARLCSHATIVLLP